MKSVRLYRLFGTGVLWSALFWFCTEPADAEQTATIELPVYATEAQNGYREMFASAGRKSTYLLGDASHGTEEFYAFRRQITEHLIRDHGVRTVILEEEWDSVELINRYVHGALSDSLSTRTLLDQALPRWPQWLWNNFQMVEFVDWLKEWNRTHADADQVRLLGMDMKEAILPAIDRVLTLWPESVPASEELVKLNQFWNVVLNQHPGDPESQTAVADAHFQIQLSLSKLGGLVDDARPILEMLDFANRYYRSFPEDIFQAWNIRSEYMAKFVMETVDSLQTGNSLAVWAHNNHVGDKSADDVRGSGLINMGQLLRERIGKDKVFILGSASYQGEVRAARSWQGQGKVQPVAPAREHSVERLLYRWQWSNPLLYWDTAQSQRLWSFDILHRGIGVEFDSTEDDAETWSVTNIAKRYDALVFWKITGALRQ